LQKQHSELLFCASFPSGKYFARLPIAGKLIRKSLKTGVLSVADANNQKFAAGILIALEIPTKPMRASVKIIKSRMVCVQKPHPHGPTLKNRTSVTGFWFPWQKLILSEF
jgi:hypothetical protein